MFCHSHGFMVFSVFIVLRSLFVGSSVFSLYINGSGCTLIFLLKSVSAVCCPLLSSGFQLQSVMLQLSVVCTSFGSYIFKN